MKTINDLKKDLLNMAHIPDDTQIVFENPDGDYFTLSNFKIVKFYKIVDRHYEFDGISDGPYKWISDDDYGLDEIQEIDPFDILDTKTVLVLENDKYLSFEQEKPKISFKWEKPKDNNLSQQEYEDCILSFLRVYGVGESKRGFSPLEMLKEMGGTEVKLRAVLFKLKNDGKIYSTGTTKSLKYVAMEFKEQADYAFDEINKIMNNARKKVESKT